MTNFSLSKPTTRIEIFKSQTTNRWHWRARSTANNKIVATPGEGFYSKSNAKRAVTTLLNSVGASDATYVVVVVD